MFLTLGVSVLLDVPDGVQLVDVLVGHDLVLVEAPVRVERVGELHGLAGGDVDEADLRADRRPHGLLALGEGGRLVDDLDAPVVLRGHRDVVVDVACDLELRR